MIAFGSAIVDPEALPPLRASRASRRAAEPGSDGATRSRRSARSAAATTCCSTPPRGRDDLEALVLVDQHVEIADPGFCAKLREALARPGGRRRRLRMGATGVRIDRLVGGRRSAAAPVRQRYHEHGGGELPAFGWAPAAAAGAARGRHRRRLPARALALGGRATLRFDEELQPRPRLRPRLLPAASARPGARSSPRRLAAVHHARSSWSSDRELWVEAPHPRRGEVGRPDARRRAERGLEGPRPPRRGRARRRAHAGATRARSTVDARRRAARARAEDATRRPARRGGSPRPLRRAEPLRRQPPLESLERARGSRPCEITDASVATPARARAAARAARRRRTRSTPAAGAAAPPGARARSLLPPTARTSVDVAAARGGARGWPRAARARGWRSSGSRIARERRRRRARPRPERRRSRRTPARRRGGRRRAPATKSSTAVSTPLRGAALARGRARVREPARHAGPGRRGRARRRRPRPAGGAPRGSRPASK